MGMQYNDMKTLLDNLKTAQKGHEKFIRDFLVEMGLRAMGQTKALTPVDTGNLRNRWELSNVFRRGDELYIVLFNPAEYASFVEDGHWQRARWVPGVWSGGKKARFTYVKGSKEGMMLAEKFIPGNHMARITINKIENEIPARYSKALKQYMQGLGVGD